jgi:hypothetical protein
MEDLDPENGGPQNDPLYNIGFVMFSWANQWFLEKHVDYRKNLPSSTVNQ